MWVTISLSGTGVGMHSERASGANPRFPINLVTRSKPSVGRLGGCQNSSMYSNIDNLSDTCPFSLSGSSHPLSCVFDGLRQQLDAP